MYGPYWVYKLPKIEHTCVFSQGKHRGSHHSLKWVSDLENKKIKNHRLTLFIELFFLFLKDFI